MKLQINSPINIMCNAHFINTFNQGQLNLIKALENEKRITGETDEYILELLKVKLNFSQDFHNYKSLVLSEQSYKNLASYKVPTEIRVDVLRSLPNRKCLIQVNEDLCYKYEKNDESIRVLVLEPKQDRILFFFGIRLSDGLILNDYILKDNKITILDDKEIIENYYAKFMVLLTYIELTDVTFDICEAFSKRGNILKNNFIKNETNISVIQVNSNWNINKILIGDSFQVKGHWRLQPCGEGRKKFKYTFIDTYAKTGVIIRKAGKELIQ